MRFTCGLNGLLHLSLSGSDDSTAAGAWRYQILGRKNTNLWGLMPAKYQREELFKSLHIEILQNPPVRRFSIFHLGVVGCPDRSPE